MCNCALLTKPLNICSTLSSVFHRKYDPQAKLHSNGLTNIKWAVSRNRAIVAGLKVHWKGKGWKGAMAFAVTVAMIAFQVDHNGKSGLKSKGTAMHANCYLETTHCNRDAFVLSPIKDLCCHALRFHALGQLIQLWGFLDASCQYESEDDLAAIDVFFFNS